VPLPCLPAVEAGTVAVTWEDCGAKHATVTDLEPLSVTLGTTTTLTGTGTVDEDITAAEFTAVVYASGVKVTSCSGDGTVDIVCKLPLGAGQIAVKALDYPIAAGTVTIEAEMQTSSLLPASLAKVDAEIRATEQNGEDAICLNVHAQQQLAAVDCSGATCTDVCDCANSKCSSQVDACLADASCSSAETCVFSCACGDVACAATCAATSGSSLANDVITCLSTSCTSQQQPAAVDCSGATCTDVCTCANSKCSSQVDACLADASCASAQTCVLGCACGDVACAATCAATSGSSLANDVITCLSTSCTAVV